jgi:hypothetical protein
MSDETRPTDPFRPTPSTPAPPSAGLPPQATSSGMYPSDAAAPGSVPPAGSWSTGAPYASPPPAPVASIVAPPKKRSAAATFVNVLLGLAVVIAVGGVAFAAGRATAPAATTTGRFGNGNGGFAGNGGFGPNASGAPGRGGFGGAFGGAGGGVSIQGTVTAVASDSITLQLASGQTITIPTSSSTTYHSQTPATAADVTAGKTVQVQLGGGRFRGGANGANGGGGGTDGSPTASGAPGGAFNLGAASSVTIIPTSG